MPCVRRARPVALRQYASLKNIKQKTHLQHSWPKWANLCVYSRLEKWFLGRILLTVFSREIWRLKNFEQWEICMSAAATRNPSAAPWWPSKTGGRSHSSAGPAWKRVGPICWFKKAKKRKLKMVHSMPKMHTYALIHADRSHWLWSLSFPIAMSRLASCLFADRNHLGLRNDFWITSTWPRFTPKRFPISDKKLLMPLLQIPLTS